MNAGTVTLETVVHDLRKACRAARRSGAKLSISIVAANREWAFQYDGVTDRWAKL